MEDREKIMLMAEDTLNQWKEMGLTDDEIMRLSAQIRFGATRNVRAKRKNVPLQIFTFERKEVEEKKKKIELIDVRR